MSSLHATAGKFDEARTELDALPRETWTPRVTLAAGQLDVRRGRFKEAAAILSTLKQIAPESAVVRYWLGYALLGIDRPEDALAEFRAAANKAPGDAMIRFGIARALGAARQPREALTELRVLAKPLEKLPDYYVILGLAHLALGSIDEAINAGRTAVTLRAVMR